MSKISEFTALSDGYLGPGSIAPPRDVIHDLVQLGEIPARAYAVPTADGAVAIAWREGTIEYTAQILPGHRLFLCTDDTSDDELREVEVDFEPDLLRGFLRTGAWS